MSEEIDYAARVQRGITLLDQKWPAWATEIDLDRLDIQDGTACMTAQYAQKHGLGTYWWTAVEPLGLADESKDYEGHGFNADASEDMDDDSKEAAYEAVNGLWKAAIEARRAQAQDAPAEPEATA